MGRGAAARQVFLNSLSMLLLFSIGCLPSEDTGRREHAEQVAHQAEIKRLKTQLAQHPDDHALLERLGKEHWALGELDEAERSLRRAVAVSADPEARLDLLSVLYARGHYVEVADVAKIIIGTDRNALPVWVHDLVHKLDRASSTQPTSRGELQQVDGVFVNSVGMRFVKVPGGSFPRGDDHGSSERQPVRTVSLSPYFIGQYEVTAGQFKRFLDDTHYPFRPMVRQLADPDFSEYPAAAISWLDAEAFAIWLSTREDAIYRLPTEAEWEFAARGPQGYREPWGNEKGREQVDGNWGRTAIADLTASRRGSMPPIRPVGSFARDRSPFGVFDMAGNVREWCLDEYDDTYYSWSPSRNPFGPMERKGLKVLRGGAWNHLGPGDFAILRWRAGQNQAYTGYGFRIVREVENAIHPSEASE
jgi:sulfatase modifying factor 1